VDERVDFIRLVLVSQERAHGAGMRTRTKIYLLYVVKFLGGFYVCRLLTKKAIRILCYHGISIDDEHRFRRKLFMRSSTFRRRMAQLAASRYNVIGLEEAIDRLRNDTLPSNSVVITIDDGWYGCLEGMFPVLRDLGLASTLYLTTYYAEEDQPVFDVIIGYLLWKTDAKSVELDGFESNFDLSKASAKEAAAETIVQYGNEALDAAGRLRLVTELAEKFKIDLSLLERRQMFRLLPLERVREIAASGVDVQLHTHRHRLSLENPDEVGVEIRDNRERLEPAVGHALAHLCYPSGIHHPRQFPWLEALGLKSATTTQSGFCYRDTERFALPRIVDGEDVHPIEFEAELAGVLESVRRVRRLFARRRY